MTKRGEHADTYARQLSEFFLDPILNPNKVNSYREGIDTIEGAEHAASLLLSLIADYHGPEEAHRIMAEFGPPAASRVNDIENQSLLDQYDISPRLRRIRVPSLVLAGQRDLLVGEESLNDLCAGLPHAAASSATVPPAAARAGVAVRLAMTGATFERVVAVIASDERPPWPSVTVTVTVAVASKALVAWRSTLAPVPVTLHPAGASHA